MKKLISVILALTLAVSLAACGGNAAQETEGVPAQELPASALEILETVWAEYAEEEKFPVIGGSMAAPVDGAPGSYDLADENITYSLLIPAEQLANVTEAASMIHMMNANTFTSGVVRLAEGTDAEAFAQVMRDAIQNNQWMCGFPETLTIAVIDGEYVLIAFGVNDAMTPFKAHFHQAYADAEILFDEAIAG